MLVKNFTKIGNSYAVLIDRNILEMLGFDPENDPVQLRTDGAGIYILPVPQETGTLPHSQTDDEGDNQADRKNKLDKIYNKLSKKYSQTFKNLAK